MTNPCSYGTKCLPISVPAQIIFTLPCGGWDNNAVDDAQLPADFVVDYVRVWQRKDLAQ